MISKHIAAIEIGSSLIKGIVATAEPDGRLRVVAVDETASGDTVRFGRIQNAREAGDLINDLLRRLENHPKVAPGHITALFIADGGRSLKSASSEASLNFGNEEEITKRTLDRLHKEALFNLGTERDILAIAPRRFFVDSTEVKKIVGTFGSNVRGEFTIITQAPENHRALERLIIESKGEDVKRDYVTRLLAQTEMALSDSDRQVGSLFIDFGAETTSMAAFREGALVFAATIPVGGANITRDLSAALNVTFEKAENLKRIKGEVIVDRAKYDAPDEEMREIVGLVSARAGEIVANVNNILELAGFRPSDFPGGLVITGGATRLKGFPEMVQQLTKMKVREAEVSDAVISGEIGLNLNDNFDIIALARYAAVHSDMDCMEFPAGHEAPSQPAAAEEKPAEKKPVERTSATAEPERKPSAPAAQHGRRMISEDDPNLLKDDEHIVQPANVNTVDEHDGNDPNQLPKPSPDANRTRFNLLQKIKGLMKPPIEGEDGGMDE